MERRTLDDERWLFEDDTNAPETGDDPRTKRSMNSYYGKKIGLFQTLALALNTGLLVYAHVSQNAVIFCNRDPKISAANNALTMSTPPDNGKVTCDAKDLKQWIENGGNSTRAENSMYCSITYNGTGCLLDSSCIKTCFEEKFGYSPDCSSCFGNIPGCIMKEGCLMACFEDSLGAACQQCTIPCLDEFKICTGFPEVDSNGTLTPNNERDKDTTLPPKPPPNAKKEITTRTTCNAFELNATDQWYNVYNLTFAKSIRDAWHGDAKLLAVIIVLFSVIWPYLKNLILVTLWYVPTSAERQTTTLLWLSRLCKYSLVDVFAVIGVLVGVQLELNIFGIKAITRAEPRAGIIVFFLATAWQFLQIELIKTMHQLKVLMSGGYNRKADGEDRLLFSKLLVPVLILAASLGLFISGATTEFILFETTDTSGVCKRSYNLVTLGNALIDELNMTSNSAPGLTWMLYLIYITLNLVFPIITHLLQLCFIVGWFRSKKLKKLIEWTLVIWCFACIEVFLIGIFAVEHKYSELVSKIAGDSMAGFFTIQTHLGPGFYLLIAYAVVAGFLQFSLRVRNDKYARVSLGNDDLLGVI